MKFWLLLISLISVFASELDLQDAQALTIAELSEDEMSQVESSSSKSEFQAEVNRLMEIIIHSLYKNRDIFLRELISNAVDALDKMRYQSLTNKDLLGEHKDFDIRVQVNKDAGLLTIKDTGVGMTGEELSKNLGTIAHSGTAAFVDAFTAAQESGENALPLIGQFGVGFYSAFLVADEVTVVSKSYKDGEQNIWRSKADGKFSVAKDPRGDTLGRGTAIILKIKEDAKEFLESSTIERTIQRYSEFMQYPIYLYSTRTEKIEVPDDEDTTPVESDDDDDDDDDDEKVETVCEVLVQGKEEKLKQLLDYIKSVLKLDYTLLPNSTYLHVYGDITMEKPEIKKDSWGKKSLSSLSNESVSSFILQTLFKRDKGVCNLHGRFCNFSEIGNMDSFVTGHISSKGKNHEYHIKELDDLGYTNQAINFFLWCNQAELAWHHNLFHVDTETGNVCFADEFPFKEMQIKENAIIKICDWTQDIKESQLKPPKWLLEISHKKYLEARGKKYDKYKSFKTVCEKCGRGFKSKLVNHNCDEKFSKKKIWPTKLPLCHCSVCANNKN